MINKKLFIIAASVWQIPVIQKAQSMGLAVVATDRNPDAPGLKIADFAEVVDVLDMEGMLNAALKHRIDGIIAEQTDISVPTAAYIAEKMGLPGVGYETALNATNKWLMREKCKQAGIPAPEYRKVNTLKEALNATEEIGLPIVMKPVDQQASRGVAKIWDINNVSKWFDKSKSYSREGSILIEKMMFGTESSAESFVIDGKVHVFGICDKTKGPPPYSYDIRLIYPAFFSDETMSEIKTINEKIIKAIGINMGITHAEYIITDKGVRLIEIAARGCGSGVATMLIPAITGVDIIKVKIKQAIGEETQLDKHRFQKSGILEFLLLPQGKIKSITGLEIAKKIKGVIDIKYNAGIGDTIGVIESGEYRPGHLLAFGESRKEVLAIAEEIKNIVKVDMENINVK